jgi:AraC-like DNA-binding protein
MGRGVLHQGAAAGRFRLARYEPSAALAPFVDFHWVVRWDLRGQPAHEQTILPHPNVNLAFEDPVPAVYGVDRALFTRRIDGTGKALGVRFRAGCFRPFWNAPVSRLNDRVVPAAEIFGPAVSRACQAVMAAPDDSAMMRHAEELLCSVLPGRDPAAEQVAGMVARVTGDSALRRVDELAEAFGMPVRTIQRLFAEYVGVSPKWVIRRARLHEAAERADRGGRVDWAALAADLGYADQAHLTRDFTATIGVPPARYASA